MTSKQSFRSWCRNLPEPHAYVFDGEKILLGKGAHRFSTAEAAIRAKDPAQCDAVDKEGAIIRTFVFRAEPDDEEQPEPQTGDAKTLHHFATLLANAYKQGAKDHADAYAEAHKQVVNLCNGVLGRCASLEKLLNQMLRDVRIDAVRAREELEEAREDLEDVLEERRETQAASGGGKAGLMEELVKRKLASVVAPEAANGGAKQ